jgi:alkylhydroperoxidase/carboxymuconolactone decarboxylase family protein YurZ
MKLSLPKVVLALSLAFAASLRADLVTLKDGKTLEGTILEETPTGVKMKYKVTPKIWDEKIIPMAEIAPGGIVKEKPEEIEIKELRKLVPTPDLLSAEKYEQIIQDRLRPFVNRYTGTKEADEIKKMIDDIQAEKEKVVAGGIKLEGKWLDATETRAEKYNIEAYRIRQSMNEKASAGDLTEAMREFDKLLDKKAFHFASIYFPKAIEEAKAHLAKLDAKTAQMIKDQPVLQKLRDESLKRLVEPDLSRTKSAIEKEESDAKTRYDEEKKETKWITPYKYDIKAIQALSKHVVATKLQLEKYDIETLTKINQQVAVATRLYYADKLEEGWKELGTLAAVAQGRQEYSTLIQTYQTGFQRKHYELAARNAATQNPVLGGGSSAVAGSGTPGTDDAVARALAMAASGGQPGAVPAVGVQPQGQSVPPQQGVAPQPGMPQQVPGAVPAQGQQPGAVQPSLNPYGQQPGVPGAGVAPNSYAQPQPGAMGEMPPPVEESMSMNTILMIAGGGVLLVLLLAVALNGKKKK